jgi:Domain of unknown function (DUF4917)
VNDTLGLLTELIFERYRSVQRALGHAIREVHLIRSEVPDATLAHIRSELLKYEWIFTTSYDLLLYWAIGSGGRFPPFLDHFRGADRLEFHADNAQVRSGQVPIYFLHGALHLVVAGSGVTWKLKKGDVRNLLDQFGEPIPGDPQARPLFVTEGTASNKLRAIEGNTYLVHALDRMRSVDLPIVVFGSSLSPQDDHLVAALNEHPRRPLAISMPRRDERELAQRQADIYARLQAENVRFFDAATHPLGSAALRAMS